MPFCLAGSSGAYQVSFDCDGDQSIVIFPPSVFHLPLPFSPLNGSRQVTAPLASKLYAHSHLPTRTFHSPVGELSTLRSSPDLPPRKFPMSFCWSEGSAANSLHELL